MERRSLLPALHQSRSSLAMFTTEAKTHKQHLKRFEQFPVRKTRAGGVKSMVGFTKMERMRRVEQERDRLREQQIVDMQLVRSLDITLPKKPETLHKERLPALRGLNCSLSQCNTYDFPDSPIAQVTDLEVDELLHLYR